MKVQLMLVVNSNLGTILPRSRDIAGFLPKTTATLFHPNVGVFPLDKILDIGALTSEDPKLLIRVITLNVTHLISPR